MTQTNQLLGPLEPLANPPRAPPRLPLGPLARLPRVPAPRKRMNHLRTTAHSPQVPHGGGHRIFQESRESHFYRPNAHSRWLVKTQKEPSPLCFRGGKVLLDV